MKKTSRRQRRRLMRAWFALALCALVMLASLGYMFYYEHARREIVRGNAGFSALYEAPALASSAPTAAPAPEVNAGGATEVNVGGTTEENPGGTTEGNPGGATEENAGGSTALASMPEVTAGGATARAILPTPSAAPSPRPAPSFDPTPEPTPEPSFAVAVDATRTPRATADADTLVIAAQTPPPVQQSFAALLALNPEAVGFLTIDDVLSLPVTQRPNDNDFYLNHSFDGQESLGGTLFLDGSNLLVPEDDCLIVYGHNMKNGTMFRPLVNYAGEAFLREHPRVRFDTIYENRAWLPFAALTVTADPGSERYLNLRQFRFDEPGFDRFVTSLRALSLWDSSVEVRYGDKLLLLVTCEYTHDNGRFVLALRAAREGES